MRYLRRRVATIGILICSLSAADCTEKPSIDEGAPPYELPAGYGVVGSLTHAFCVETLRVGDTVSAVLSPSPFSRPMPWPRRIVVLLRRDVPTGPGFSSVSADADGYHIDRSIGGFVLDIEIQNIRPDRPRGECYGPGSRVAGSLSQPLRIPRMQ